MDDLTGQLRAMDRRMDALQHQLENLTSLMRVIVDTQRMLGATLDLVRESVHAEPIAP